MLTNKEIKDGLDKAYAKAGANAYFGNGFKAGVKFATDQHLKNNKKLEMDAVKPFQKYEPDNNRGPGLPVPW